MSTAPHFQRQPNSIDGVVHSQCVQMKIGEPTEAASAFNKPGNRDICLVAVPRGAVCCCSPWLNVPSGYWVLYQRWYKNMGAVWAPSTDSHPLSGALAL